MSGSISTIDTIQADLYHYGQNTNASVPSTGWSGYVCTGDHPDGGRDTNIRVNSSIKNFTVTDIAEGGGGDQAMPRNIIMPFFLRALNI